MSIYGTTLCFDDRDEPDDEYQQPAPIRYQGSSILPSDDDPRGGNLDFAEIPGHITRDGRDDAPNERNEPAPAIAH